MRLLAPVLCCLLALGGVVGCALTPTGQARVDALERERADLQEDLQAVRELNDELRRKIAAGEEVDPSEIDTLAQQLADLNRELDRIGARILEAKSEDRGRQASLWVEALLALGLGGSAGGLLSRLGPSRGADKIADVRTEIAALQAALGTLASSGSRAAPDVARLNEKVAQLERMLAAFQSGLQPPQPEA